MSEATVGETAKRLVAQRRAQASLQSASHIGIDPKLAETRETQLRAAFSLLDKDASGLLSLAEITSYFQSVTPQANLEYVREIYRSLDANGDGQVSIAEFTSGYLQQVGGVTEALVDLQHHISSTKAAIAAGESRLEEIKKLSRTQNEYGVPTESRLRVTVREAQRIPKGLFALQSYVELTFDKQTIRTRTKEGENPHWEEDFEFLATRPDGVLLCKVMRKDAISSDDLVGQCAVPLAELSDQRLRDVWRQLELAERPIARILLSLQLLFDEGKALRQEVERLQRAVTEDELLERKLQLQLSSLGASPLSMFASESLSLRLEQRVLSTVSALPTRHLERCCRLRTWRLSLLAGLLMLTAGMCGERSGVVDGTVVAVCAVMEVLRWTEALCRLVVAAIGFTLMWDALCFLLVSSEKGAVISLGGIVLGIALKVAMCVVLIKQYQSPHSP